LKEKPPACSRRGINLHKILSRVQTHLLITYSL
jgi:hypothetical protein